MNAALQNLGRSAAGMFVGGMNVKAVLCVKNPRIDMTMDALNTNANAMQAMLLDQTASALSDEGRVKGNASKTISDIRKSLNNEGAFLPIEFQFNPSTIRLETIGGEVQNLRNVGEGVAAEELREVKYDARTVMSFDIIFDDTLNVDAFTLENITPNIGNITAVAKSIIKDKMSEKETGNKKEFHSIRRRMDALMGLLTTRQSQQVIFFWANMSFRGSLTRVTSEYTMFNPKGNPIRGKASLQITQDEADEDLVYDDTYWDNAFTRMFEEGGGAASAASKAMSNTFININL